MNTPLTAIRLRSKAWAAAVMAGGMLAVAPGAWLAAPVAQAHDSVIGGSIETDEVVEALPDVITLEFSGIPQEGFNTIAVSNVDTGEVLFSAEPSLDGRNLSIEVPEGTEAGPGQYQVGFSITSSDGHATRGAVPFSIAGGEEAGSGAASAEDATANGSTDTAADSPGETEASSTEDGLQGPMKWIAAAGGVLALIAVAAVMIAKRRTLGEGQ